MGSIQLNKIYRFKYIQFRFEAHSFDARLPNISEKSNHNQNFVQIGAIPRTVRACISQPPDGRIWS